MTIEYKGYTLHMDDDVLHQSNLIHNTDLIDDFRKIVNQISTEKSTDKKDYIFHE